MASEHTCSLSQDALASRIDEWRALGARAVRRRTRPGVLTTVLPRTDAIIASLHSLIAAEAACCSFLTFDVRERDDEIELQLRYPEGFDVEAVFGRA
jgi:hypothetical protein